MPEHDHLKSTGDANARKTITAKAALGCLAFASYLLVCAYVTWHQHKWAWLITPLQLDIFGFVLQVFPEPVGAYIGAAVLGLLGLGVMGLGVFAFSETTFEHRRGPVWVIAIALALSVLALSSVVAKTGYAFGIAPQDCPQ